MVDCRSETPLAPGQQEVDRRNARMLHIKSLAPRLSAQAFTKAIDDDKRSTASGQSAKALSPALFFDSATSKSAAEIGEAAGTGDYPGFDKSWDHWLEVSNPNASKLSDHEKASVEEFCITDRHNTDAVQQFEELMEQFEGVESDDVKFVPASVDTDLQYLDVSVVHAKNDYGQKWFHTLEQVETNRLYGTSIFILFSEYFPY